MGLSDCLNQKRPVEDDGVGVFGCAKERSKPWQIITWRHRMITKRMSYLLTAALLSLPAHAEIVTKGMVKGVEVGGRGDVIFFTLEEGGSRCQRRLEYGYVSPNTSNTILSFLMTSRISRVPVSIVRSNDASCDYNGIEMVNKVIFGSHQ